MRTFLILAVIIGIAGLLAREQAGDLLMCVSYGLASGSEWFAGMASALANDTYGVKWFAVAIVLSGLNKLAAKLIPSVIKHR